GGMRGFAQKTAANEIWQSHEVFAVGLQPLVRKS
ncbi:MAG: hypothetical protein JWO08_3085, partial [Verrucomicrobiaceae bacterium]|nr:hypothetical protein [Verrucomicrobiaceae bacterium]